MLKKTFLLTVILLCLILRTSKAVENPYVSNLNIDSSMTKDVRVEIKQTEESSKIKCSYQVTNNTQKPISVFSIGEDQLPFPPLNWADRDNPSLELSPQGWFESFGENSNNSTYSLSWQAKTTSDLLQPNHSQSFKTEFPIKDKFECTKLNWNITFATVYPILEPSPTTLSITLSNLKTTQGKSFQGDILIKNLGPNDTVLNLGTIYGESYPDRLFLMARDTNGNVQKVGLMGPGLVMGGRTDPMIIQLPQEGTYAIPVKWWTLEPISSGDYRFYVEFEGSVARTDDSNSQINFFKYWSGKIDSNEVSLVIP